MKKAIVLILTSLFLYGIAREVSFIKFTMIFIGLITACLIYLIPARHIVAMKYPFIIMQLAITVLFFVFPHLPIRQHGDFFIIFAAFYSIIFYLITIEEKGQNLFKEVTAVSVLYFSAFFNLLMVDKPVLIISIALPLMLYLFILGHNKVIPFIAGYTVFIIVALVIKKFPIIGTGIAFHNDMERYVLLLAPLFLLILSFVGFVKKSDLLKVISFMGLMGISIDILMVVGLKISYGIICQPLAAVLIIAPLAGIMMKTEREGR